MVRILVVDDFLPWHGVVTALLELHPKFQVVSAAMSGPEALRKVRLLEPDLVLLDVGLPAMNGLQVAREIKLVCPRTRIIFLSADDSKDIICEAFLAGARGYICKRSAAAELIPALEAAMAARESIV